jgi:5-(carboxyamino)imidazole ribonucleotide synthase
MIQPPAALGMLGGGQLGRFFTIAAHELGYRVSVLDPDPHSPAGRLADRHLVAGYDDPDALDALATTCAAVTTEFENVPAAALDYLSKFVPVRPSARCVEIAQNRVREKTYLLENGFAVGPFAVVSREADLDELPAEMFPGVLKVSRFGYDGKGQARVADAAEARAAFRGFRSEPCVLERFLPLECEISVVLARTHDGGIRCFPPVENAHRRGILDVSIAPARIDPTLREAAEGLAAAFAESLDYVGVMGVEFFVHAGRLLINEVAPRPHNSAHFTIDACAASQFDQQVRALCGLPLAEPRQHTPAAMVNLLGDLWYARDPDQAHEPEWERLLEVPGLKLHLYGKRHARPGRKMGHFTVIDTDARRAVELALSARRAIGIHDDAR